MDKKCIVDFLLALVEIHKNFSAMYLYVSFEAKLERKPHLAESTLKRLLLVCPLMNN